MTDSQHPDLDAATQATGPADPAIDTPADSDAKGNREAAKYRTQLRAVEAERDSLASALEAYRRADVTQRAEKLLAIPSLLFADGRAVADYLDDAGSVDPAKVEAGVQAVLSAYGPEAAHPRTRGNVVPSEGRTQPWPGAAGFTAAFGPSTRA